MDNPRVFFDILSSIDKELVGRIVIELFADKLPRFADNFRCLCTGEKVSENSGNRLHYKGSVISGVTQTTIRGDIRQDGSGGESIYGEYFQFDDGYEYHNIQQSDSFMLSMVPLPGNFDPRDTRYQSHFCISKESVEGSNRNVVCGKVVDGISVIERIINQSLEDAAVSLGDTPTEFSNFVIQDCGMYIDVNKCLWSLRALQNLKEEKIYADGLSAPALALWHKCRELPLGVTKEDAEEYITNIRKNMDNENFMYNYLKNLDNEANLDSMKKELKTYMEFRLRGPRLDLATSRLRIAVEPVDLN